MITSDLHLAAFFDVMGHRCAGSDRVGGILHWRYDDVSEAQARAYERGAAVPAEAFAEAIAARKAEALGHRPRRRNLGLRR